MKINITSIVPPVDPNIDASEIFVKGSNAYPDYDDELINVEDTFMDIISSGQGGGCISDSDWRIEAIDGLFTPLTDQQKSALFVYIVENMPEADGWYIDDVAFLKDRCGIESFQAVFTD